MVCKNSTLKTASIIGTLSLASALLSIAYAESQPDNVVSNVTALVVAFGSVMGAIAAIATSIVGIIRSKTGDKIISDQAANDISKVADSLKETDNWIHENQARMTNIVSAISNVSPDAKKALEENGINIQALTNELSVVKQELDRLHAALPGSKP